MAIYETVYIARPDLSNKQVEELTKKFSDLLTANKGKILKTENWGLRSLAYKINKNKKGHYVLIESETDGPTLLEAERLMRIEEDVMRFMTIKLDQPTTDKSAVLRGNNSSYDKREAA